MKEKITAKTNSYPLWLNKYYNEQTELNQLLSLLTINWCFAKLQAWSDRENDSISIKPWNKSDRN